jgi:hypothetical protein
MDTRSFCTVCEHRSAGAECGHCGAAVCRLCFDAGLGFCRDCAERVKSDGRRGDTFTL